MMAKMPTYVRLKEYVPHCLKKFALLFHAVFLLVAVEKVKSQNATLDKQ